MSRARLLLLATLGVLLVAFAGGLAYLAPERPGRELSLDQLDTAAADRRIARAELRDQDAIITGTLKRGEQFSVAYPRSDAVTGQLVERLGRAGARVRVDAQPVKAAVRLATTFLLPLLVLATIFALLLGPGKGGGMGEIASFGTLRGRGRPKPGTGVTFADVAGADEALVELREVVDYLRNPERYHRLGAQPPKGVLLLGPPGCGKTLLARAVAGEAGVPFFSVAGAEFVESLVGVGAARVRDLFASVRAASPAILFIDEVDAAGRRRGSGDGGGSDEREQTLNQLLVEMDGFEVTAGIVVIAATNRPDILDPALLRPGRFDRHVTVDQPDREGRLRILELHAAGKPLAADADLPELARRTPGFTGADLASVLNEAALLAVRDGRAQIGAAELSEAVQRVRHGPQRRGHLLTNDERHRVAVHEAGHAVVRAALDGPESVDRVSVLARGRNLAGASTEADDDAAVLTRSRLESRLAVMLAGLAAEELLLDEPSTGAELDLERATDLAREMAGRYGMSPELGRARLLERDLDGFLGATVATAAISEHTHRRLDEDVATVLSNAESRARAILTDHRDVVDRIAEHLAENESVEGASLAELLRPVIQDQASRA